jgi:hypothetical protein
VKQNEFSSRLSVKSLFDLLFSVSPCLCGEICFPITAIIPADFPAAVEAAAGPAARAAGSSPARALRPAA